MNPVPNPAYQPPTVSHSGRAIEVTGMLGDSVVCVKHLSPEPPPPRSRTISRLLLGAAAVLLTVSALSFAKSVSVAADNKVAFEHHTAVLDKPVSEFRPRRLGAGYDVMAFGGLAGGLLGIAFVMIRRRSQPAPSRFSIGCDAGVDFEIDNTTDDRFELVKDSPQGPVVAVAGNMAAMLRTPSGSKTLDELVDCGEAILSMEAAGGYEILLPLDGDVRVDLGLSRFLIKSVPAPRRQAGMTAAVERRAAGFFLGSAIVHAVLLALIWNIPTEATLGQLEEGPDSERYVYTHLAAMDTPVAEPEPQHDGDGDNARGEAPGPVNGKGSLGTTGTPDSIHTNRLLKVKQRDSRDHLAKTRADAVRMARTAGVLGYFASEREIFTSLSSTYDYSSGYDDDDIAGGYTGSEYGDVFGPGGPNWGNSIHNFSNSPYYRDGVHTKIGYDTGGDPNGNPLGTAPGLKGLKRNSKKPPVVIGTPVVSDGLDRSTIRRYIRTKIRRISHCYDRQLIGSKDLAGTVKTRFTISPQGRVQGANSSGMNAELEGCVTSAISSIQFPKTSDGTSTRVTYPFHFRQAGS